LVAFITAVAPLASNKPSPSAYPDLTDYRELHCWVVMRAVCAKPHPPFCLLCFVRSTAALYSCHLLHFTAPSMLPFVVPFSEYYSFKKRASSLVAATIFIDIEKRAYILFFYKRIMLASLAAMAHGPKKKPSVIECLFPRGHLGPCWGASVYPEWPGPPQFDIGCLFLSFRLVSPRLAVATDD
jgi:hypothetical protein